jgi:hypothetical protein
MAKKPTTSLANNSMSSKELFEQRETYRDWLYPTNETSLTGYFPKPIDLWYNKGLYGKVDEDYNAVFVDESYLKSLSGAEESFVLNFVADAFDDFKNYMILAANKGKLSTKDNKFLNMIPKQGWSTIQTIYFNQITAMYQAYVGIFLAQNSNHKKIITFSDFMDSFSTYLERVASKFPFSRSGLITSQFCSIASTGLSIELHSGDHGDDKIKLNNWISDPNYNFYVKAARKHGFFIDKNAPWRLVADIKSKKMQEYMSRYPEIPPEPKDPGSPPLLPVPNTLEWFKQYVGREVEYQAQGLDDPQKGILYSINSRSPVEDSEFSIIAKRDADFEFPPPGELPNLEIRSLINTMELYYDIGEEKFKRSSPGIELARTMGLGGAAGDIGIETYDRLHDELTVIYNFWKNASPGPTLRVDSNTVLGSTIMNLSSYVFMPKITEDQMDLHAPFLKAWIEFLWSTERNGQRIFDWLFKETWEPGALQSGDPQPIDGIREKYRFRFKPDRSQWLTQLPTTLANLANVPKITRIDPRLDRDGFWNITRDQILRALKDSNAQLDKSMTSLNSNLPWITPGADWQPLVSLMAETLGRFYAIGGNMRYPHPVNNYASTFLEDYMWKSFGTSKDKAELFPRTPHGRDWFLNNIWTEFGPVSSTVPYFRGTPSTKIQEGDAREIVGDSFGWRIEKEDVILNGETIRSTAWIPLDDPSQARDSKLSSISAARFVPKLYKFDTNPGGSNTSVNDYIRVEPLWPGQYIFSLSGIIKNKDGNMKASKTYAMVTVPYVYQDDEGDLITVWGDNWQKQENILREWAASNNNVDTGDANIATEPPAPPLIEKIIVPPNGTKFIFTGGTNTTFHQRRQDFEKEILRFPEKNRAWNDINDVHENWIQQSGSITNYRKISGPLAFDNLFQRQYIKSFELDIQTLKVYTLDYFNSFVKQNPTVTLTKLNKCGNGTVSYVKERNFITEDELNEQYDDVYWLKFYASLRILESGRELNKTAMNNFLDGVKNLLAYDPNGMIKALRMITKETNGVNKPKLLLTPPANYDKLTEFNRNDKELSDYAAWYGYKLG